MQNIVLYRCLLVAGSLLGLMLPGCSPPSGGNDNTPVNSNDNTSNSNGSGVDDCDSRTVSEPPAAGHVELVSSFDLDAGPEDSALEKVIFSGGTCLLDAAEPLLRYIYEIDEAGQVLRVCNLFEAGGQEIATCSADSEQQLVVEDGCLDLQGPPDLGGLGGVVSFDPSDPDDNPCEAGQLAIAAEGLISEDTGEDFICVELTIDTMCVNCRFEEGTWFKDVTLQGAYVALGSLEDLSVSAWASACSEPDVPVDISEGDRIDITWSITSEFSSADSPEDLGFTVIVLPSI